jgi:hypothetical protein
MLHGLPQSMLLDCGPQFVAKFMCKLYHLLRITILSSTAYHPQSNGQTKHVNQELKLVFEGPVQLSHLQNLTNHDCNCSQPVGDWLEPVATINLYCNLHIILYINTTIKKISTPLLTFGARGSSCSHVEKIKNPPLLTFGAREEGG